MCRLDVERCQAGDLKAASSTPTSELDSRSVSPEKTATGRRYKRETPGYPVNARDRLRAYFNGMF
jgi:hypothetical protein